MSRLQPLFSVLILILLLIFSAQPVYAVGSAGFENASLSAKALGRANAYTARSDDPSAIAHNPAGMSQLKGLQFSGGLTGLQLRTTYDAFPGSGGGVSTRNANKLDIVPNFYATLELPVLPAHVGFGLNSPFGLRTEWSSTHPFRYVGHKNELLMLAYTVSGSIQVHPQLSVGAGATYYDADLKQRAKINSTLVTQNVFAFLPAQPDARLRLDTEGNGWGWNLGVLWKPHDKHQVGFHYRSQARLAFKGNVQVENIAGPIMTAIFGGPNFVTGVNTDIRLPPQMTFAYQYKIFQNWDVELDLAYTRWSTFDDLEFAIGSPNPVLNALTPIPHGYKDTVSVHLGSDWELNKYITLRAGYFFYQTPSRETNMGPVIPDGNRQGIAAGLGLNYRNITVDLAYIAEWFTTRKAKNSNVGRISNIVVDGDYSSFVNLLSFNVTYRFDWEKWFGAEVEEIEEEVLG